MPNHITSYVQIKGDKEALDKLKKKTLTIKDEVAEFDFNGIIKTPDEIARTGSPTQIVATQEEADKINEEHGKSPFNEGIDIWAITEEEKQRRLKKYGAINWYDFHCDKWGTKWGAYDVSIIANKDDELVMQHDSAWSPPEPIWDKLSEMGFTVNAVWQDEDPSNQGEYGDPYEAFDIDHRITVEYMG